MMNRFSKVFVVICMGMVLCGCVHKTKTLQTGTAETLSEKEILSRSESQRIKGNYSEALKIIDTAIQKGVETPDVLNEKGALLLKQNNPEEAHNYFKKASAAAPGRDKYLYNQAYSEVLLGEYDEALSIYETILKQNRKDVKAYFGKGVVYTYQKDYATAVACFSQALKHNKNYFPAVYNRGIARQRLGDFQGSLEDFMYCIKGGYKRADSFCHLGVSRYLMGDDKLAITLISKAIDLNNDQYEFYYNLGVVFLHNLDYKLAIQNFTKALVFNGDFVEAYVNRGDAYMRLGSYDEGSRDLQVACNLGSCVKFNQYKALGSLVDSTLTQSEMGD
ncbi:tetratricopeptide repeat protein [Maridesulfovibrio bastinii]|uniref:tetratricopeptide repeat protein n=1 Tax=Maridesulfovibrio bastinii TaxID=47157 RepID=UPI00042351ED|nr:tetratricopeptide repeat protein [Maridesulfovibrio bastinii]